MPVGKVVEVILDNYAVRKLSRVRARLDRHPRLTFRLTPKSASWLNAVERTMTLPSRNQIPAVHHFAIDPGMVTAFGTLMREPADRLDPLSKDPSQVDR